ncbi:unnamed protein product, partial [Owenia fusiformis]
MYARKDTLDPRVAPSVIVRTVRSIVTSGRAFVHLVALQDGKEGGVTKSVMMVHSEVAVTRHVIVRTTLNVIKQLENAQMAVVQDGQMMQIMDHVSEHAPVDTGVTTVSKDVTMAALVEHVTDLMVLADVQITNLPVMTNPPELVEGSVTA